MFHITSLFPNKSLRQDRLGIYVLNTSATESCFFMTILYSCGNWSSRDLFPSHMSSQNLTCDPSFIIKVNERLAKSTRLRAAELLEREILLSTLDHLQRCRPLTACQRRQVGGAHSRGEGSGGTSCREEEGLGGCSGVRHCHHPSVPVKDMPSQELSSLE